MLSERRQRILQAVIEEYVQNAMPVASKTLMKNYGLGVSSATIRNELSVLEGDGYIVQPHTSAGRIPTDYGYRTFVDDLLASGLPRVDADSARLVSELRESARELDELMERTSQVLARMTDCLSLVIPPSALSLHLKQINLVLMAPTRVLMVIVTESARVMNRAIELSREVTIEELSSFEGFLNQVFAGKNFQEMRVQLESAKDAILADPIIQVLVQELFSCLKDNEAAHAHKLGISSLVSQPEFNQSENILPVLKAVEDGSVVVGALKTTQEGGVSVSIGHENDHESLSNVSVVAARYGRGEGAGVIAVIGPTRMPYRRVISAIQVVQHQLNDL